VTLFSESTYKLPNRVVYNETMKKSFLNDLADEGIPLNSPKFAKSIPHGMKGQDLLEMLWTRRIKVDRAAWLVQIIGAHDVVSA
jgi:mediator of RNA polymerase II transcription subunit 12